MERFTVPSERIRGPASMYLSSLADGALALERAEQYRKNAADSLLLASEAMTQSSQEYWITMAEFWFQFAQHVEQSQAAGSVPPNPKPGADRHR